MNRVIAAASHSDKQQAIVDCMLATWSELEAGAYGFRGYDYTYKVLDTLNDEQIEDVANAIKDRQLDKEAVNA